jgi:hypothetical protein
MSSLRTAIAQGLVFGFILFGGQLAQAEKSSSMASPKNVTGKLGETVVIESNYKYEVINPTDFYQTYEGFEELEVNNEKFYAPINFTLAPHARIITNNDALSFGYKTVKVGNFIIRSAITIEGEGGTAHHAHATLKVVK